MTEVNYVRRVGSLFDELQQVPAEILKSKLLSALLAFGNRELLETLRTTLDAKPLSPLHLKVRRTAMEIVAVSPLRMYEAVIVASFMEDLWIGIMGGVGGKWKDSKGRDWIGLQDASYSPNTWGGYVGDAIPLASGGSAPSTWTAGYDKKIFQQVSWREKNDPDRLEVKFNLDPGFYNIIYHVNEQWYPNGRYYDIVIQGETRREKYCTPEGVETLYFNNAKVEQDGVLTVLFRKNLHYPGDRNPMFSALEVINASYDDEEMEYSKKSIVRVMGGVAGTWKDSKGRAWYGLQNSPYSKRNAWGGWTGSQPPLVAHGTSPRTWTPGYDRRIFEQVSWRNHTHGDHSLEVKFNVPSGEYEVVYHVGEHWNPNNRRFDIEIQGDVKRRQYCTPGSHQVETLRFPKIEVGEIGVLTVSLNRNVHYTGDKNPMFSALEVLPTSNDLKLS